MSSSKYSSWHLHKHALSSFFAKTLEQQQHLDSQVGTAKRRLRAPRVIVDDSLYRRVQTRPQQEQATRHDKNVYDSHQAPPRPVPEPALVHLGVSNRKEDEAEEGVEGGA